MFTNSKSLKKLRKVIRTLGDHLPVRQLDRPTAIRMVPDYSAGLNLDGTAKLIPLTFPLPARNVAMTQRGVYRNLKKEARN